MSRGHECSAPSSNQLFTASWALAGLIALVMTSSILSSGCDSETSSILLTVESNLEPGIELDGLDVALWREGAQLWAESYDVGPGSSLQWSQRILQPSARSGLVGLSVRGTLGGAGVVEARRETTFVTGQQVDVRVCLWRRCGADRSLPGCDEGLCGTPDGGDGDADSDGDGDGDGREALCSDRCVMATTGTCDDGGWSAEVYLCDFGTDCTDCGPRFADECVPRDCTLRRCGSDGCGGQCGEGCGPTERCMPGGVCIEWVPIDAALFEMGSPDGELGAEDDEVLHAVTLTHDFEITAYEVTEAWLRVMTMEDARASTQCGNDCAVGALSWNDAVAFTASLSLAEGLVPCYQCGADASSCEFLDERHPSPYACDGYRLPTEAEWELAARAGTTTATYNGNLDGNHLVCLAPYGILDPIAWYCGNSHVPYEGAIDCFWGRGQCGRHPVGMLQPNAFGLYDMLGNVSEWVHDLQGPLSAEPAIDPDGAPSGGARCYRGGSFYSTGAEIRAADRSSSSPAVKPEWMGFRIARTLH